MNTRLNQFLRSQKPNHATIILGQWGKSHKKSKRHNLKKRKSKRQKSNKRKYKKRKTRRHNKSKY